MRIAFLGWGSLIWNPGNLQTSGSWERDGPFLPIEFARVSEDGRLTLALYPNVSDVQTLWVRAACKSLQQAIGNLREREGTLEKYIGFISMPDNSVCCDVVPCILPRIKTWVGQKGLDAVVWTDLRSNFEEKTGMVFNEDNVVKYLRDLKVKNSAVFRCAEDYVRKTPQQIETKIRNRLRQEFGW